MTSKKNSKKIPKNTRRTRTYDNTSRSAKSEQTGKNIIEALVALLVERQGADVSMDEVAAKCGITQRTIFRFFKDKETLHKAMDTYLFTYLQTSMEQMSALDFIGFSKNAFILFDKYESLTLAYLLSPFGKEARGLFRKKLTQAMINKIVKEKNITLNPETKKRLTIITSLVNAKIWYDIKTDFGYTGLEMSETIEWALTALLEKI